MAQTKVKLVSNGVITVDNLHTNHGITTDHIGEGSVLYYTDARVANYLTTNNYITTSDVAANETLTSLSLNANTLSYIDEAGNTTNLDLSLYLDDTNLARLVSGTLDGNTGIATFTRDDASTFTIDFSSLTPSETDPVFTASAASSITSTNISNWDTAYSWGNHASAGYLTSFTESDPTVPSHVKSITTTKISNWDTAFGWGNHASAGYLTSVTNISGYSGELIRTDNRTIAPNELGSGRMSFGFTSFNNNNTSPWADFIHLRGYTDNSGGNDHLLVFNKSNLQIRLYEQTYGSATAYSSYVDFITTGSDNQIKSGYFQSNSSLRSPIFYDSNNTGYYVNPSGNSVLGSKVTLTSTVGTLAFTENSTEDQVIVEYDGSGSGATNYFHIYSGVPGWSAKGQSFNMQPFTGDINIGGLDFGYKFRVDGTTLLLNDNPLTLYSATNGNGVKIKFSDHQGGNYGQNATMEYVHTNTQSYGSGHAFKFYGTESSMSFHVAGTGFFTGDVTAYYSDMRLKTKLGPIENPIDKINSLNGFYYEPNKVAESYGYKKEKRIGLSAQEIEAVLPEIVTTAPIGDGYKAVDYAKLVPLLIEAVKEQQQQIEELKQLVNK